MKALASLIMLAAVLAGLTAGCATGNGHRSAARAGLGFVDFRSDPPDDLAWQVSRFDFEKRAWLPVWSDFKPPASGVLRLACAPGPYQFQVTFLNRVVLQPALVPVEVVEGLTTPVSVALIPNGTMTVDQKQAVRLGAPVKSAQGQRSKYNDDQYPAYQLDVTVQAPVTYHPLP